MNIFLTLLVSLALVSCASTNKDFNREPNQVGGGGGNVGSVQFSMNPHLSYSIAGNLASKGYSCRNEKTLIQVLLSENPKDLNRSAIDSARQLYDDCLSRMASEIVISQKPAQIFTALQSKKYVCRNEIESLENALADGPNNPNLSLAKKSFEDCKTKAIAAIQSPK